MGDSYLDKVYDASTPDETKEIYGAWAKSYDAEVGENGYATPARCAEALKDALDDQSVAVLDFGCGTGLSGIALRAAGFETIDGVDLSPEMLAQAEAKGAYRNLRAIDPSDPLTELAGTYRAIAAIGVIGAGAAPPETMDLLIGLLPKGGLLVFSYNDHTLDDPFYTGKLNEYLDAGAASLRFEDYGDHLPGIGMKSRVYVLEKM